MPRVKLAGSLSKFFEDNPTYIAIDTETTGTEFYDVPFYATVAWRSGDEMQSMCLALPEYSKQLGAIMENRRWVFHHAKFDLQKLILIGVIDREDCDDKNIEDTEAIAHLLDENQKKNLKDLARRHLGKTTDEETTLRRVRRRLKIRKDEGLLGIPSLFVVPYALKDAEFTLELYEKLFPRLDPELESLYDEEIRLSLVLLDMESRGLGVDVEYAQSKAKELNGRILEIDLELEEEIGKEIREGPIKASERDSYFNPNYHGDIKAFFAEQKIKLEDTTERSLSRVEHPVALLIVERRKKKKLVGSWLETIIKYEREGVYHGNFRQHGTRTGRLSSGSASYE